MLVCVHMYMYLYDNEGQHTSIFYPNPWRLLWETLRSHGLDLQPAHGPHSTYESVATWSLRRGPGKPLSTEASSGNWWRAEPQADFGDSLPWNSTSLGATHGDADRYTGQRGCGQRLRWGMKWEHTLPQRGWNKIVMRWAKLWQDNDSIANSATASLMLAREVEKLVDERLAQAMDTNNYKRCVLLAKTQDIWKLGSNQGNYTVNKYH